MNRIIKVAFAILFSVSAAVSPDALAQKASASQSATVRSYAEARRLLNAGLDALGGLEAIRAAENVSVKISGHAYARNQSVDISSKEYDRQPHTESLFIDLRNRRYIVETLDTLPGGFVFGGKNVINGGQGFFVNPRDRTLTPINMANFNHIGIIRRVPHVMLLALLDTGAASLRSLGMDAFDGRPHKVVTAASSNGVQWTLYFDAKTNLLSKYEQVISDNATGDAVRETIFPAYRTVGRVKVPTGRVTRQAGEIIEDVTYEDVQFNTKPAESVFAKPDGLEELSTPSPAPTRETKLAEGVYLFESAANSLVVEFDTYVLVVEPYVGGRGPKPTINKTREMFPTKPVKYVVVTHYHDDHSGGLRSYIAEDVAVVTTPSNRKFFERMAAGTFTVAADGQSKASKKPVFEFVEKGKRVFTDGKQTVELYDIGPSPHAREMLIAYLPKEKLVFQGDLVNLPDSGRWMPTTINEATLHFADAIRRLNLDVQRVASVHGPSTTWDELRAAIDKRPQSAGK